MHTMRWRLFALILGAGKPWNSLKWVNQPGLPGNLPSNSKTRAVLSTRPACQNLAHGHFVNNYSFNSKAALRAGIESSPVDYYAFSYFSIVSMSALISALFGQGSLPSVPDW